VSGTEPRRFSSSGGQLAYVDVGEGEPVVLLHGFPSSSATWRDLAPALAPRFRVIVPDLLGHGLSDRPTHAPLDLPAQARYVRELLEHLGVGRVAIVGHAHGGGVAQLLALDGVDVGAMILVSAVAFDAWPVASTRDLQAVDPERLTRELLEAGMRAVLLTGVADPSVVTDELVAAYVAPWISEGGPASVVRAANAFDGHGLMGHEDTFARWSFPILILWGEDDPYLAPSLGERLQDAMPSSALGLLPGVGHFVFDEAGPTIVPMLAEWLRARYLGAPHDHGGVQGGVVMVPLERRSAVEDLAEYERNDPPVRYDPRDQEVGPNA
jgi:2-hydroxymuconate-semialdehyde hydrolase